MIDIHILQAAVMDSRDGITIADFTQPDNPLIFVNPAFEIMSGYSLEESVGKNCRYLQGDLKDQEDQLNIIRAATANAQPCLVTLKNYRKDGSMFWNELSLSPIFNTDGQLTHYIGIQKDVTSKVLMEEQIKGEFNDLKRSNTMLEYLINIDPLTGLHNRRYLDDHLVIQTNIAKRNKQLLTVFMLDIDHFKKYNDTYGHPAGDAALKAVAHVLNSAFLKSTDFVARYGGEEFIILTMGGDPAFIQAYADEVVKKVSNLQIPHSSSDEGVVTISLGFSAQIGVDGDDQLTIVEQADQALYEAKTRGRNRAIKYTKGD